MNESIKQGLVMTIAGILFCLAVTLLLHELKAVIDMEKAIPVSGVVADDGGWY